MVAAHIALIRCETCKGKGHVSTRIGDDVHIATCADCEGWGRTEPKAESERPKFAFFGKVDIDSLLGN